jgi:drug/metabolite transporter (DMT)-like permease
MWLLLALGAAVGLNATRFLIWGYTHRHYPLSHSYPLTALFFPCILLLSAWYGDTIGWAKVVGVLVIMAGVVLMNWDRDDAA